MSDFLPRAARRPTALGAVLVAVALAPLGGCATDDRCVVSGAVDYGGAPIDDGLIMFIPQDRSGAQRTVSAQIVDGRFEVARSAGLVAGQYRVAITSEQPTGRKIEADPGSGVMIDEYAQVIPDRYNAATTLTANIQGDAEGLSFSLTK